MKSLPDITVVIADTVSYGDSISAIQKTLKHITPAEVIFFTDVDFPSEEYRIEKIPRLNSKEEYSSYMLKMLGTFRFKTSHLLVIQHDGYVVDGEEWDDEFLEYDYIGAPWMYVDGRNVGNGGFSLRSVRLHQILVDDEHIGNYHPEDDTICRGYRRYLESSYQVKFAPEEVADRFSYELRKPKDKTFGFHGKFHPPYREPIVFKRSGALGDVIAMEPLLDYFFFKGHDIVVDSPYALVFARHFFQVTDYKNFDHEAINHRTINLDMAYEVKPKQLHLKSYFEIAGVTDYKLRNPHLRFDITDHNRLFKKYVVLHIDFRETNHRNIHNVSFYRIKSFLEKMGYTVIQIGRGMREEVALEFNCPNEQMMMYLIAGCELFIGVDSGPAQMAVALDKKCIIFFGSVNAEYIHPDLSKVTVIQGTCPVGKQHCWHDAPGTRGVDCVVDPTRPPCTIGDTEKVVAEIKKQLQ